MWTSPCTLVFVPLFISYALQILLYNISIGIYIVFTTLEKNDAADDIYILIIIGIKSHKRGRCCTLKSRYIYGSLSLCRNNYRISLKYFWCLVSWSRWGNYLPRGGVGQKIDTEKNKNRWAGSLILDGLHKISLVIFRCE